MLIILVMLLVVRAVARLSIRSLDAVEMGDADMSSGSVSAVGAVLRSVQESSCSVVLLTDGTVSHQSVFKVEHEIPSPYGIGLMEIPFHKREENSSGIQFTHTFRAIKKFRQSCQCLSVVVVSRDAEFLRLVDEISAKEESFVWSTRVLVVTELSYLELRDLMEGHRLFTRLNVMVINRVNDEKVGGFNVYSYLPYSPEGPKMLMVARWSSLRGLQSLDPAQLFPRKYDNFYGAEQQVTAILLEPYWQRKEKKSENGTTDVSFYGREYLLLETLASTLNFTFNITPSRNSRAMLKFLTSREDAFALALKFPLIPKYVEKVDFAFCIDRGTLTFNMAMPSLKPKWQSFYLPLADVVWLCTFLVILLMPLVLNVVVGKVVRLGTERDAKQPASLLFLKIFAILLGQDGLNGFPRSSSTRLVLLTWLVFSFIMGAGYRGNLIAFLTVPEYPKRIESVEQLAPTDIQAKIKSSAVSFYNYFKESELPAYREVSRRMTYIPDVREGLQEALDKNLAFFHERLQSRLYIVRYFTSLDGQSKLYVANENVLPIPAAWMVPRGAPYVDSMNPHFMHAVEAGLLEKWINDVILNERKDELQKRQEQTGSDNIGRDVSSPSPSREEGNNLKALNLVHMEGPIFLLLVGIVFAGFALLAELIMNPKDSKPDP